MPGTFLANGKPDRAWQWMQDIYNQRNDPQAVAISESGRSTASLTNNSRNSSYTWNAGLRGTHPILYVNGSPRPARTEMANGVTYSYLAVPVAPQHSSSVSVSPDLPK